MQGCPHLLINLIFTFNAVQPEEGLMKTLRKETLLNIVDEFPSFTWDEGILEELIDPKLGVITAFSEILDEIETLLSLDLGETGLSTGLSSLEGTDE